MKRRLFCLLLIVALGLSSMAFAAETPLVMMGLELGNTSRVWANNLYFSRTAETAGISFTFRQYTDEASYRTALHQAFETGDLPDVLFKAALTSKEEMQYAASGQLVDLSPYLAEHAPNLSAILDARPDWREIITQPGGAIASLPILSGAERQCLVWINSDWLKALSLSAPTTIDEYTEVLRAFRDGDPNGNGKKDEVPLSLVGPWEAKFLLHAFGIVANDYNVYLDADGQVRYAPFDPAYRDFVEWLRMAHEESLIDPNAFRQTQASRNSSQAGESDPPVIYGGMISIAPYTVVDLNKSTSYAALYPLTYDGKQVYRKLLTGVGRGAFAITSACKDIPAALGWVDALYTEAGGRLAFAGVEGEDYTTQADGSWKWSSGDDYTALQGIVDDHIISGDAYTPGLEPAAFLRNSEITDDAYTRRQTDTVRDTLVLPYPITWPQGDDVEARIAELQAALGPCVDTAIANFAMGITELTDETWAAFHAELKALGADELVQLLQQAVK